MRQVRVIAGEGTGVRGPARVQITLAQMLRCPSVLGSRWRRGGVFDVRSGSELPFERGEVFGIAEPAALDRDAVEPVGWDWNDLAPVDVKSPAGEAQDTAPAAALRPVKPLPRKRQL
jgi:hypothetical protein